MPSFTTSNTVPPSCCSTCSCPYGRCVYTYTMTVAKADGARSAVSAGSAACVPNASLAGITWGWSKTAEDATYCYYQYKQEGPCCTADGDPCEAPEFSGPDLPTPAPDCTIGGGGGDTTCVTCNGACISVDAIKTVSLPTLPDGAFPNMAAAFNSLTGLLTYNSATGLWEQASGPFMQDGYGPPGGTFRVVLKDYCNGELSVDIQMLGGDGVTWSGGLALFGGSLFIAGGTVGGDYCVKTYSEYTTKITGTSVTTSTTITVTTSGNSCCKNEGGECVAGTIVCADGTCNPLP